MYGSYWLIKILDIESGRIKFNNSSIIFLSNKTSPRRVWKELTLNSTTDQSKYRVWDYPIKEQYTHILQIIDSTGPVESSADAFDMVRGSGSRLGGMCIRHSQK